MCTRALLRLTAAAGMLGLLAGCAVYPAPVYDAPVAYGPAPVVSAPPTYYYGPAYPYYGPAYYPPVYPSVSIYGRFGSGRHFNHNHGPGRGGHRGESRGMGHRGGGGNRH